MKLWGLVEMVTCTAHATQQNTLVGSIPKFSFSLVETVSSISWSLCDLSQPDFHHVCPSHIYICHTSHILCKNLQAYNIEGTVQDEKEHKFQRASKELGIV